eukprot:CAMPEP_0178560004 /NCGR_PEP_ID=MMETSP0697-20121206/11263_1 /TAXON_ID=265572 /ORGANISM="Extubocellulus spinifer, Strain CCMP396" /LENGTH=434 /DNA_ID=CAMNT_0020193247 /DNA_START=224 /DNA_END=1529 /DNA_ORIENTATION=-
MSFARRTAVPAAAYLLSASSLSRLSADEQAASCEAPPSREIKQNIELPAGTGESSPPKIHVNVPSAEISSTGPPKPPHPSSIPPPPPQEMPRVAHRQTREGMNIRSNDDETLFHGLFPARQLFHPKLEWPLWNYNWDGRRLPPTGDADADKERDRAIRKNGVTRHIILVRHGQYDETHKEDEKRILTPLGREQADITGRRIAEMVRGFNEEFGPCNVKVVRVSDMARAKETADLICKHLPDVERAAPDPLLNEGRPCHHIPGGKASASVISRTDENHPRIEKAYRKFFYRADRPKEEEKEEGEEKEVLASDVEADTTAKDSTKEGATVQEEPQPQDGDSSTPTTNGETQPPAELKPHPKHEFEIIVGHANVIRYFTCRALQIPPEAWLRLCTFNCSLTYLTIRPTGSVSCRMLGDIGHLGLSKSTFSGHHGFNW